MTIDEFVNGLSPILKSKGYSKTRMTWRKETDDITLFFHIQKSQFDHAVWYYHFGLSVNALSEQKKAKCFNDCHLWDRISCLSEAHFWQPQEIAYLLERWEYYYGSMNKLHDHAIKGKLPEFVRSGVIEYISGWYKFEE